MKAPAHAIGTAKVDRRKVTLIAYNLQNGGLTISTAQAMLALGTHAWYFTLSVLPGDAARLRPVFAAMLRTFRAH